MRVYPKAARHFLEHFPNHYLDFLELKEKERLEAEIDAFEQMLNTPGTTERTIQAHIKEKRSWFIVGGILKGYANFGHHAAFIFPEFPLGVTHQVDYLLVGQNSGGFHFVFVELEAPDGAVTRDGGKFGVVCRKGLDQAHEWKVWLESNYPSLKEIFDKYKNPNGEQLPDEFSRLDSTRLHYCVVAGRRKHFTADTYRLVRDLNGNQNLIHYDNLVDCARLLIASATTY